MRRLSFALLLLCVSAVALWAADLPVTDVVLFSSGVGYFQRAGTVQDNATVELSFKTDQINDLLKSMLLLDLDGGTVPEVTYSAQDPIAKALQAFAVDITDNPSMAQLLNRLRGVDVEIVAATAMQGKILGVESKTKQMKDGVITVAVLNLVTDTGIRSVPLDDISSLKILDPRLNCELQDALQVLAGGLDNQRKPVLVSFAGKGTRHVVIGYLAETPIWKTSYRLVLDEKPLLQGWGIVENTSDIDWTKVHLALVSGRPISFIEDLYTSYYLDRPVVQPQLIMSIRPVTYGTGIPGNELGVVNGAVPNGTNAVTGTPAPSASPYGASPYGTSPYGTTGTLTRPDLSLSYVNGNVNFDNNVRSTVVSAALAHDLGEGFEYAIKEPVTLARQKSAMLPIVSGPIEATQLSIYNPQVQKKYALIGARLKNTTGLHLMGGPITVYHHGVYAGDATFEDLQPGAERLISYAVDLGVTPLVRNDADQTVMPPWDQDNDAPSPPNGKAQQATPMGDNIVIYPPMDNAQIIEIKIVNGQMSITRKAQRTVTYLFAVKDGKARTMLVEHPFQPGWTLVAPAKADEVTETLYRFTVPVSADKVAKLAVTEQKVVEQTYVLSDVDTPTLLLYVKNEHVSKPVRDALQHAADLRNHLADLQQQRTDAEGQIVTISTEQDRLRRDMGVLDHDSDLYKRYVAKMNDQETKIDALRATIDDLRKQQDAQEKALKDYINGLKLTGGE